MGFRKIGDVEDKKEMTAGYSLYKQTETNEIFYRFTCVESRQGSGGKKKVALVAQKLGDRNCMSVQNKYKAIGIMEEAIRKGVVVIPGAGTSSTSIEPFRDYVKRQLVIDGDVYRWRNRRPRKPISPNSFDKYRAAFVHNAYDYLPPTLTLVMTKEQDMVDLAEKMREATKVIRCKGEDGEEIEKEVPRHSEDVIRSCLEGIKLVCEYAKQVPKIIDVNPVRIGKGEAISFARPEPPHREILSRLEVVQLLSELKTRADNPMRGRYWERVYMAVKLGVYAGLREGEIRALKRNKIRPLLDDNGKPSGAYRITVDESWCDLIRAAKTTKGNYARDVFIWRDLAEELLAMGDKNPHGNGFIFFQEQNPLAPMYKDRILEYTYAALDAIGIGEKERAKRKITVHSLRHFFVSATESSITNDAMMRMVREEVGHRSSAVHKIYQHETFERAYAAALISRDLLQTTVPNKTEVEG